MKRINLLIVLIFSILSINAYAQPVAATGDFNLGFEKVSDPQKLPDGWFRWGHPTYEFKVDSVEVHSGRYSLRVEPGKDASEKGFGCPTLLIPARYEGKQIVLKAFMKAEGNTQPIGLMLRIDGEPNVSLQFDNMMKRGIKGTDKWEEYSVQLPLPENAKKIYIGFILSGPGKLWADDFQVLIDGKALSQAPIKEEKLSKADMDTVYDAGSKIIIPNYTVQMVSNLELLGKVWGFLKYYHPAAASGDYNWDYELFRVMPSFLNAKDARERDQILIQWINRLGDVKPSTVNNSDGIMEVKLLPDLAWMEDPSLDATLRQQLNTIKNADRELENYYIALHPHVGNPNFKNEKAYPNMAFDDAGFRLLALYRYWNMIQYFFPYRHLTSKDWNMVLGEFIPHFLDAKDESTYKTALLQLIAQACDTHANIWSDGFLNKQKGSFWLPYDITFVENKPMVTRYWNEETEQQGALRIGDIITAINNQPVDSMIGQKLPYTPASNYETQLRNIAREFFRTNEKQLSVEYLRGGQKASAIIESSTYQNLYANRPPKECYRMLADNIGYIYPGTIKNDSLPKIMEMFKDTKGLVIDFRCYPSNFIVFTLGAYLMSQPVDFVKFTAGNVVFPGRFTFGIPLKVGKENNDYYKGKVVIIVDETTQSSAEYHTMAFRAAPKAKVIGSITAAADGNVSSIVLPGNVQTMISGIGVYYPDGRGTQRIGIVPDIEIKPTIKGIIEGRDELLERAVGIILR